MYAVMEKYDGAGSDYDFALRPFEMLEDAYCYIDRLVDASSGDFKPDSISEIRLYKFESVNKVYDAYYVRESEVKL